MQCTAFLFHNKVVLEHKGCPLTNILGGGTGFDLVFSGFRNPSRMGRVKRSQLTRFEDKTQSLGFAFLEAMNGIGLIGTSHKAMMQYKNDRVEGLIALVNCEECILHDRNMAVWTLGQLTDKRALPTLRKYSRPGMLCNHRARTCQQEIAKAIKWTEGNSCMFPQIWRVLLRKDFPALAKTCA